MRGHIFDFNEARLCGHVWDFQSGRRYFYHVHNVRLDELGQQLPRARDVGATVEFSVYEARPGWMVAYDLHPYEPFAEPVDLRSHRELSTVVRWKPDVGPAGAGLAQRESGDWISFRGTDVITEGLDELTVGMSLWHGIGFAADMDGKVFDPKQPLTLKIEPKDVVRARHIEICMPEKQVEPEPELPEPTGPAEAVHPLLTARKRAVRLRDIRFKKTA
jgi:hypothetical protein